MGKKLNTFYNGIFETNLFNKAWFDYWVEMDLKIWNILFIFLNGYGIMLINSWRTPSTLL